MATLPKSSNSPTASEYDVVIPKTYDQLNFTQQQAVDFKAVNGLMTDADGNIRKVTVEEFARSIGRTKDGVNRAIRSVPNFWELVNARRKVIGSQSRLAKVHDALYLQAAKGSFQHLQLYLANFDSEHFRMPTQKIEHDVGGGLADLLNRARERRQQHQNVQEGEVVQPNQQPNEVIDATSTADA